MIIDTLLDYYSGLLIIQYRTKEKAVNTVKLFVGQALVDDLLTEESTCFDLDTAVGAQLDVLGRIVGVPRNVIGLDLVHQFFHMGHYSGGSTSPGMGQYTDAPYSTDLFRRYTNDASYKMSDFEMRSLIKLKIVYNTAGASFKGIKEGLYEFFNRGIDLSATSFDSSGYFQFMDSDGLPKYKGFGYYPLLGNGSFETWTGLTNLLTNGGFETWTTPSSPPDSWANHAGATGTIVKETGVVNVFAGANSCKMTASNDGWCYIAENVACTTGHTYVFSLLAKSANSLANQVGVFLQYYVGATPIGTGTYLYYQNSGNWENLSIALLAPATADNFSIIPFVDTGCTAPVYFDNANVYEQLAPTGWALAGTGATVARDEGTVKVGTYSAKLTRNGTNIQLNQDIVNAGGHNLAYWKGKTVTVGCWVNSSVADRAFIQLADGVGVGVSPAHSGDGTWQYLTATRTVDSSATILYVQLLVNTGDTSAYFDGAVVTDPNDPMFNYSSYPDWNFLKYGDYIQTAMELTYYASTVYAITMIVADFLGIVPKPIGVHYTIVYL